MNTCKQAFFWQFCAIFTLFFIWPVKAQALTQAETTHLLNRTAFGPDTPQLQLDWAALSREEAIQKLLASSTSAVTVPPPLWLFSFANNTALNKLDIDPELKRKLRNDFNRTRREHRTEAKEWWIEQIDKGESPLTERLILFWHNHFSVEITELPAPQLALTQQLMLRQHVTGNYRELLKAVNRDPAMLIYLNNNINHKKKPNENYARELLELFTLGEGHYSEADIKELSRAMTGAGTGPGFHYRFHANKHDKEPKSIFGKTAKFNPNKVIDLILKQPRAAEFLVEKLWAEFVSNPVDEAAVKELAQLFRDADYEIQPLLSALFNRPEFWADENRSKLLKSPIELVLAEHYRLGIEIDDYKKLRRQVAGMGQDLLDPPNVAGWPQHQAWINSDSLVKRTRYLLKLRRQYNAASVAKPTFEDQLK